MNDLISRQGAIDAMLNLNVKHRVSWLDAVIDTLDDLPSTEPQRKIGRWIDIDSETYTWKIRCDKCGHERSMLSTQGNYPKFCERCGAKMEAG